MDLGTKTANDLLSKDFKVALSACDNLINHKDFNSFEKLANASEFIFPFIKEKINNNLIKRVNQNNYKNLLSFMKLYSYDFEDFIVQGLVKFASQDLTDEIYEVFENGSIDEKIYCASYFSYINDEIALELLNKYALSDNEDLAQACAGTLAVFNDREVFNKACDVIKNTNPDDFIDNVKYFNFLVNYGDCEILPELFKYAKESPACHYVLPDLLNLVSYMDMVNGSNADTALKIYIEHLDSYPEFLSLSTLEDFEIFDFIEYLFNLNENNADLSLAILKTKEKFDLFKNEEAYKIDLNKNEKDYLNKIIKLVESKSDDFYKMHGENLKDLFNCADNELLIETLNIISELRLESYLPDILNLIETSDDEKLICEAVVTLKALGKLDSINKDDIIFGMKNENIKAIVLNCFD